MMKDRKLFITGEADFIATNMIQRLIAERGYDKIQRC